MASADLACETTFCTWVHHHRDGLRIAECAHHTILMPCPTLLTSPLTVITRGGGDDGDGCVDDCQVDLHVVARSTSDKEVLAFAHVVWTPRRSCRGLRTVLGRVDGLLTIRVPEELELRPARCADPEGALPCPVVVAQPCQRYTLPLREVSNQAVIVLVLDGKASTELANRLPINFYPLCRPSEVDVEDRASLHLAIPAVHEPLLATTLVVGALHPYLSMRPVNCGIDLHRRISVQAQVEELVPALPQDHGGEIPTIVLPLHLLHRGPAAPRAADEDTLSFSQFDFDLLRECCLAVPETSLVHEAGDVIGCELLAEDIGLNLLPNTTWCRPYHRLARDVVDLRHGNRARHGNLIEVLQVDLARLLRAKFRLAPNVTSTIRTTESKRRHASERAVHHRVNGLRVEIARETADAQVRIELPTMGVRRTRPGVQHDDALEQTGNAGASFQVADVGLRARECQHGVPRLHGVPEGPDLDGISQGSPGSMALRQVDVSRLVLGLPHRGLDACLLRRSIGRGHARASAVLVDLRTQQTSALVDPVELVLAAFQVHEPDTLAARITVAALVEGETPPIW
mmetsp:Transcript_158871/g.509420  ORF Transcript_158871/g.509420 Transcript_158871/m.509420 type:complete len:572 (-) Transcript_158871:1922-3637(-)